MSTPNATVGPAPFRGNLTLPNRANSFDQDHLPPDFGNLDRANINRPTALSDCPPGIDQHRVNGISSTKIMQDSNTIINMNENRTVFQKQTEEIHNQATLTYLNGRDVTVGNADQLSINGTQELFCLGQSSEVWCMKHDESVPFDLGLKSVSTSISAGVLNLFGRAISVYYMQHYLSVIKDDNSLFSDLKAGFHEGMAGQQGEVKGMGNKVAATHLDANVKVNPAPEIGSTHIP